MNRMFFVAACSAVAAVAISFISAAEAGPADSAGPVCDLVEPGFITVDGMIDDWRDIAQHRVRGLSKDASFSVRCARDARRLYVSVAVRDQQITRRPGKRAQGKGEDNLRVRLSVPGSRAGELHVFPGADGIAPRRSWSGRDMPAWLEVEDTLQPDGWSLELSVPLRKVPGMGKGTPGLAARIVYWDADGPRAGKGDAAAFDGMLTFRAAAELFQSFLATVKLAAADVRLDAIADVDGVPGVERVVAGGTVLGVLSDRFGYLSLPAASPADISRVEVVDLRGDGTASILTEFRQHGNGGSRDMLVIWGVAGNGSFERMFAAEVRKEFEGNVLVNHWSLVPKGELLDGRRRGKGHDILIEVSDADVQGWSQQSFREVAAPDAKPILLPWSDQTSAVFSFEGNAVVGGAPKVESRKGGKRRRR